MRERQLSHSRTGPFFADEVVARRLVANAESEPLLTPLIGAATFGRTLNRTPTLGVTNSYNSERFNGLVR